MKKQNDIEKLAIFLAKQFNLNLEYLPENAPFHPFDKTGMKQIAKNILTEIKKYK